MAGLTPPFDYATILIGEEIIFRGLSQQQKMAGAGQYGMSWTQQDDLEKSQAFFQANVMRTDFNIAPHFQNCIPEPPCPWDKHNDELSPADLMPVMMSNDGVFTYSFRVAQRTDNGTSSYTVGPDIVQYGQNQSQLDPQVQSEFAYYEHQSQITYRGTAIMIIEKSHRGSVQNSFTYLFNLI